MIEDNASSRAAEGAAQLLLRPVYLLVEIVVAALPGALFCILLVAKGNRSAMAALQTSLVGYKTKLLLAFVICYVIGKVFRAPLEMLEAYLFGRMADKDKSKNAESMLWYFVGGAVVLPGLMGSPWLDYIVLGQATVSFYLTTGSVLLVASFIPGDGSLRFVELLAGCLMLLAGLLQMKKFGLAMVALLGGSLMEQLQKIPLTYLPTGLKIAQVVLAALSKPAQPAAAANNSSKVEQQDSSLQTKATLDKFCLSGCFS